MKDFVLDTNVILHDAQSIFKFEENNVIVPMTVVEELDTFKKDMSELGRNARFFSKQIDALRSQGSVAEGVIVNNKGGLLRVALVQSEILANLPHEMDHQIPDNQILAIALHNSAHSDNVTILVSNDINMRIKADALGLRADSYNNDKVEVETLYTGVLYVDKEEDIPPMDYLQPNQFVVVRDPATGVITKEGRYDKDLGEIVPLRDDLTSWGLDPANDEQRYAMDILLNDDIKLVTLSGIAGTGKSLIATACSLRKVTDDFTHRKLLISRPVIPMGKDIGFLPGSAREKLDPYMAPIYDAVEFLMSGGIADIKPPSKRRGKKSKDEEEKEYGQMGKGLLELEAAGIVEVEALLYIRGRSIPNVIMIVDECVTGDTLVAIEPGNHYINKESIGSLYTKYKQNKPLPKVKTFNEATEQFEYNDIEKIVNKGEREIYRIKAGSRLIKCTGNHPFLTLKDGWVAAENLVPGDILKCSEPNSAKISKVLNEDQIQLLIGSYLGDGSVQETSPSVFRLTTSNCEKQRDYLFQKAEAFGAKASRVECNGYAQTVQYRFHSLTFVCDKPIPSKKTTVPDWMLDQIDARGLAIWFQDDGSAASASNGACIHTQSFDDESQQKLVDMLLTKFGVQAQIRTSYRKDTNKTYKYLGLRKADYLKLAEIIAPYVSADMHYKVKTQNIGTINTYKWDPKFKTYGGIVVTSVENTHKDDIVYDIQIKNNHNFIVASQGRAKDAVAGGPILHNCQNLSPHEVKTIVTRAGKGTKLIFTGDYQQIDNSYLDASSNGLSYLVEKFKDQPIAAHITLTKGERSELAEIATRIL